MWYESKKQTCTLYADRDLKHESHKKIHHDYVDKRSNVTLYSGLTRKQYKLIQILLLV